MAQFKGESKVEVKEWITGAVLVVVGLMCGADEHLLSGQINQLLSGARGKTAASYPFYPDHPHQSLESYIDGRTTKRFLRD